MLRFTERESGPARGLWIEIVVCASVWYAAASGPARGLWIEIYKVQVGPREGPVD